MERVIEFEEEVIIEDVGGGLERRQRKKGQMGEESGEKVINGGEHCVYFEADEGVWKCRYCTWTYDLSGPGIDLIPKNEGNCQVAMDTETLTQLGTYIDSSIKGLKLGDVDKCVAESNLQNGKSGMRTEDFDNRENDITEEENRNSRNTVTENGSSSHLSSKDELVARITGNQVENESEIQIQECEELEPGKSSRFMVAEFDVERVLEEQETHDLYCPNCHSCITKRVILRKRKRHHRENQSDLPPQKVQHVTSSALNETVDHEDEMAFRCLSCFSFFIPTESGFNIFRIFGKKGSNNLQSSERMYRKNEKWVYSLFGSSKSKANEEGVPLLAETDVFPTGDPSLGLKEKSPCIPTMGATDTGDKGTIIGLSNADLLAGKSYSHAGRLDNQAQGDEQSYPTMTLLEDQSAGESYSNSGQPGNQSEGDKQSYAATTVSKDPLAGKSYSNGGQIGSQVKQSHSATSASEGISAGESYSNGGMGNQAQEDKESDPQTTLLNDQSAGQSYGNGGLMGNQAQEDEKSYPTITVSEETSTWVPHTKGEPMGNNVQIDKQNFWATTVSEGISTSKGNMNSLTCSAADKLPPGNNINKPISMVNPVSPLGTTQGNQCVPVPETSNAVETLIDVGVRGLEESRRGNDWDVLKSIVYGGLIESITSLCVVSSAAGSGASTLHICALGVANLIGGLFLISHDLSELQSEHDAEALNQREQRSARYWVKLGKRENFRLHVVVSILSYIIFGLLPPIIYGFAFRKSDNKEHKIIAMASSSLFCIALLSIGKAHVKPQKDYVKSLLYYLAIALPASGLAYVAGVMINRFLAEISLFPSPTSPSPPSSNELLGFGLHTPSWAALYTTMQRSS